MRHGESLVTSENEQPLTPRGKMQVTQDLRFAKEAGARMNFIVTSPVTRAKQTAEIAKAIFGVDYVVSNALEPESSPDAIYEELSKHKSTDSILLVSHKPLVLNFLSDILGVRNGFQFSTGTLAMVDGNPTHGGGSLALFLPPQV